MLVLLWLAKTDGSLRTADKSLLAKVLSTHVTTPATVTLSRTTCLVIDGQALVMALGKPQDKMTFGDYAETFAKTIDRKPSNITWVRVLQNAAIVETAIVETKDQWESGGSVPGLRENIKEDRRQPKINTSLLKNTRKYVHKACQHWNKHENTINTV